MVSMVIFLTGATGYLGRALVPELLERKHRVRALVRPGSESRAPAGCDVVTGDALVAETFRDAIAPCDTFVQLVGTPKPAPWKGRRFRAVDLRSGLAAVAAARRAGVRHLVYVSVAQPAPVMKSYIAVRAGVEAEIRKSGLDATILRPWYVLGPGHRWPHLLRPAYALLRLIPATRPGALRLGLVTLAQMVRALVLAVESPHSGVRVLDVPAIRTAAAP